MFARNAGNSQLAWSRDHGKTWTWAEWKFTTSFGHPSILNFGKNYAGARDSYAYIYSPDSDSAYEASPHMVLARVPKDRLADRAAYEFFRRLDAKGQPVWTRKIEERGPVFRNAEHLCYRTHVTYNAGLKRYLMNSIIYAWCGKHKVSGRFWCVRRAGALGTVDHCVLHEDVGRGAGRGAALLAEVDERRWKDHAPDQLRRRHAIDPQSDREAR
jgi:hypothetical protein